MTKKDKIRILFVHDGENYSRCEEGFDHQEYLQYIIDSGLDDDTQYEVRLVTDPIQAMYYSLEASRWDVLFIHTNLGHDLRGEDRIRFGAEPLIRRFINNHEWIRVIAVNGAGISGEDELARQWGANNFCCDDEILVLLRQIIQDHGGLRLTPKELDCRFSQIEITGSLTWARETTLRWEGFHTPLGTSLKRSPEGD